MFLSDPRPERICKFSYLEPDKPQPMLSVGVQVIEKTHDGFKVIPSKMVVFAFGETKGDAEERIFDIPASMARALAARLIEFSDAVDKK